MEALVVIVILLPALVLRACRPGPVVPPRAFDITYPIHPVSITRRSRR